MVDVVYFSNAGGNTDAFVSKLNIEGRKHRIPIKGSFDGTINKPYVLILPTYSQPDGIVPQVKKFLKDHSHYLVGVIGTGNINFGDKAFKAGRVISQAMGVPLLYTLEIRGTQEDVRNVEEGLNKYVVTQK